MQLANLKQEFIQKLTELYDENEILSFFNLLLEDIMAMSRLEFALNPTLVLTKKQQIAFERALKLLEEEKPIQYIIGRTTFYGLTFNVNQHTLIPRPETEELVAWVLESVPQEKKIKILDIGTGSGCIAISLAKKMPNANVFAVDFSAEALDVAKQNAKLNNVAVNFLQQDILRATSLDKFDVIVSNPPYVQENEKPLMANNVLQYEPDSALFVADDNPLVFYDKITNLAKNHLTKNGLLFFEINQYLGKEMLELVKSNNFSSVILRKDIFENDRMLKATL